MLTTQAQDLSYGVTDMTGLESLIIKELITWAAKSFFDAVQDDSNNMTADQAKQISKDAARSLSDDATQALKHHLPRQFKL